MVWDATAQRLALTFTGKAPLYVSMRYNNYYFSPPVDSPSAELVAIFRTRKSELLEILPGLVQSELLVPTTLYQFIVL